MRFIVNIFRNQYLCLTIESRMSKGIKNLSFYVLMLVVFGLLMYFVVQMGHKLETSSVHSAGLQLEGSTRTLLSNGFDMFFHSVETNARSSISMLLLQIISILFVARIFGWLFIKMGQPSVIGEIVAGIILGPSVFAQVAPEVFSFLFSPESLGNINMLSQIGLILFMFAIGMELDISEVKKSLNETLLISHAGIVFPFFCGMLIAYWTYLEYASSITPFLSYSLFIGIAMSITAFPVLARIIQERGMTKSRLGTLALASAANGDVTAWCVLAVVIAIAHSGTFVGALYVILFTALFVLFMFFVMRPFFNIIGNVYHNKEVMNKTIVAFMLFFLIAFSYLTEILGIHALFGAFMTGVVMPNNVKFRKILTEKVEDVALCLFLPLFFVSTGLKTQIGLISTPEEWMICVVIILVAVFSKVIGTTFSARFAGETWHHSWTLGALMNTRGLMELIVLSIGYEMKILPPTIFVMLVIMTLVTTCMTTPLMSFINLFFKQSKDLPQTIGTAAKEYRILLSFGRASSGSLLLSVARQLFASSKQQPEITALHITVGAEVNPIHVDNFEETSFEPILKEAKKQNIKLKTRYAVAHDAGSEIVNIVNTEQYNFLLVGAGISLSDVPTDIEATKHREGFYTKYLGKLKAPHALFYPGNFLKDKTKMFIEETDSSVGIFINRDFDVANRVLVLLEEPEDTFLLQYAGNLGRGNNAALSVLDMEGLILTNRRAMAKVELLKRENTHFSLLKKKHFSGELLSKYNFMLVSYKTWERISEEEKEALQLMPSTLIIKRGKEREGNKK